MKKQGRNLIIYILLILGIILVVFHQKFVDTIETVSNLGDDRPVIATLVEYEGDVNYKIPKTLVYKTVKEGLELRDQDTVVTSGNSKAVITFISGFKLEVAENSIVVIELPQAGKDGTINVTFLRGDFRVIEQGQSGKLILTKDDKVQDASGRAPPPEPLNISLKPTPKPTPQIKTEKIEELKATIKPTPKPTPPKKRETLSDEYIAQIIKKQTPLFNRCYTEHLRLNPNARGRINLSFTIAATGSVASVRLLSSTLKDPRLEQCTMSVVERARFKKFDGDPIVVNYPINFE